jgi:hypothetical protein
VWCQSWFSEEAHNGSQLCRLVLASAFVYVWEVRDHKTLSFPWHQFKIIHLSPYFVTYLSPSLSSVLSLPLPYCIPSRPHLLSLSLVLTVHLHHPTPSPHLQWPQGGVNSLRTPIFNVLGLFPYLHYSSYISAVFGVHAIFWITYTHTHTYIYIEKTNGCF